MKVRVRKTSFRAFSTILNQGLLSRIQELVYSSLYWHGPLTGAELNRQLSGSGYHKRLSELRDLGVVEELGEYRCEVTGHMVILWDVTDALPRKKLRCAIGIRPTKTELKECVKIIRHWNKLACLHGEPQSLAIDKLLIWLSSKVG